MRRIVTNYYSLQIVGRVSSPSSRVSRKSCIMAQTLSSLVIFLASEESIRILGTLANILSKFSQNYEQIFFQSYLVF